jgi:hypothetical protein
VVWLTPPDGQPFLAPGGDPTGVVEAGAATVAYGVTDRVGALAIDTGRPLTGDGDPALRSVLGEILSGTTVHGGALLAPFGVRFVVVPQDRVPAATEAALRAQVDLEEAPSAGLLVWRNVTAIPPAALLRGDKETAPIVASSDADLIQRFAPSVTGELAETEGGWSGDAHDGDLATVATAFEQGWRLEGTDAAPQRSFGWATSFSDVPAEVSITFADQSPRTLSIWLLAAVWAVALWITRKPVRR